MATNSPSNLNIGFVNENGYDQNGRPKSPYTTSNLKSDSLPPPNYYSATQMNNINSINNNNNTNFYNNDNYNVSGRSVNNANNQAPRYPQQPMPMPLPPIRNDFNNSNSPFGPNANANANQNGGFGDFNALSDKNIRIRFVRKVYLILTSQLIFTFGIVSIFVFVPQVRDFAKTKTGLALYIVSYFLFLALIITFAICSCTKGLRKVPYNYMLLGAITISMTYMLGMISAYHSIQAVLIAVGITLLITVGVTLFAMQTKFDFTKNCWLVALCLSLALLGLGIACIITYKYLPILQAIYGGLGAVVMSIFLAIDTQMLIGNKRYKYSEEDYVNAALQLYLDICYLFLYLLQAVGSNK